MKQRRPRRTVFAVPLKGCRHCGGSGWRPVTVVNRRGESSRAVTRCECVRIIRLNHDGTKPLPADGKMLAAEGSGE
jgi:hypothetical protein